MSHTTHRHLMRRRSARRQEAMTLIEIMIVVVIMALLAAGAAVLVIPRLVTAEIKTAYSGANTVKTGATSFMIENRRAGCPDIEDLDGYVDNAVDPWGNEYAIECDGNDVTVYSAGPDGQFDTEDDIDSDNEPES